MIVILVATQPKDCPCYLCNARRIDEEQHVIEQMEARLRSLAHNASP